MDLKVTDLEYQKVVSTVLIYQKVYDSFIINSFNFHIRKMTTCLNEKIKNKKMHGFVTEIQTVCFQGIDNSAKRKQMEEDNSPTERDDASSDKDDDNCLG